MLRDATIAIVGLKGHFLAPFKLYEFLRDEVKVRSVIFLGHPFPKDQTRRSELLFSSRGREEKVTELPRGRNFGLLSFVADALLTLWVMLLSGRRYDLYVATNPLLGLLGLFLRSVGLVRGMAYWPADYFPRRFRSEVLNRFALTVDDMNVAFSDHTWDLTPAVSEARKRRGVRLEEDRVLIVPHVLTTEELTQGSSPCGRPDTLIYVGQLSPEYGFQLILEALPLVIKKRPRVKLTVTSYQPLPDELRETITREDLQPHISFLGYVRDESQFGKVLQEHRVGLAPYKPDPFSWKNFVDASKAKTYMARGLPVIITRVPPVAQEIEDGGAGVVINYDEVELAEAILRLLVDEEFYQRCRVHAFKLARRYRADRVFYDVFRKMGYDVTSHPDGTSARRECLCSDTEAIGDATSSK